MMARALALTNCRLPLLSWRPQRCIFGTEESDAWLCAKDMLLWFSFSCCFIYFLRQMTKSFRVYGAVYMAYTRVNCT